jgi:PAS domain S-box-containing protein
MTTPTTSDSAEKLHRAFPADTLLAAIVSSSDDAIISKSLDGTITSWNDAAERIFGYRPEEIIGTSVLRLIPAENQSEEPAIVAQLRNGKRIDHYETVRVHKDGRRIEVSLTVSPIRNPAGQVVGASKVARDITGQRKADHAARLLAAIVDSSDDAIISKNLNGIVTSWNRGATRLFGYQAEEMIGQPVMKLIPADRPNEEPGIIDQIKRGVRVDHYQTVRQRKDGTRVEVALTISPIYNAAGVVVGASKVARDVSREREALAKLARANEELIKADRMKSEFLAVMSHELRTPLNSIIGFASVLRQGRPGPINDEQKKQLNLIHASGKHLLHLINDLLDLSRIEAGRMDFESSEFSPQEVIDEVAGSLESQLAQKNLQLRVSVATAETVFTDRRCVFQIVLNLLNNAVKFTPKGSIAVRARVDAGRLEISVSDTGIGIPADRQVELFQAFSQLEGSARRKYEGTGLGLYLCKKLVTLLGGDIALQSESNVGSTFTFRIPARRADDAPLESATVQPALT